jgi:hypothetical protein
MKTNLYNSVVYRFNYNKGYYLPFYVTTDGFKPATVTSELNQNLKLELEYSRIFDKNNTNVILNFNENGDLISIKGKSIDGNINIAEVDPKLVEVIQDTWNTCELGKQTIRELDTFLYLDGKTAEPIKIVVSDKIGIMKNGNKFIRVSGFTGDTPRFYKVIYLFDTTREYIDYFDVNGEIIEATFNDLMEQFDYVFLHKELANKKSKEKKLKKMTRDNYIDNAREYRINNPDIVIHEETEQAYDFLTDKDRKLIEKSNDKADIDLSWGRKITLVHENIHVLTNSSDEEAPTLREVAFIRETGLFPNE